MNEERLNEELDILEEYARVKKQDFIFASSHILCETLPPNFDTWSQEKLDDFLSDNAYEPFEYHTPTQIYEEIESLAYSVRDYINETQSIK